MIERRRFKRTNIEVLANLTPKVNFPGYLTAYPVIDLGFTGLFIKGQFNFRRGEVLDIELEIPAIGKIPMSIEVARIDNTVNRGIGVEILEIPERYKRIWAHFVKACYILLEVKEEYQRLQSNSKK